MKLSEHKTFKGIILTNEDREFLIQKHSKHVQLTKEHSSYSLKTNSHVGLIQLPSGVKIQIAPKIPVRNLYFMIAYTYNIVRFDYFEDKDFNSFQTPIEMYAFILTKWIEGIIKRGVYRTYVTKEEKLNVLRGDVQIRSKLIPSEGILCRYQEMTSANFHNDFLLSIVTFLLTKLNLSKSNKLVSRLSNLKNKLFEFNTFNLSHQAFMKVCYNSQNAHYKKVIELARMIYEGTFLTTDSGSVKFSGFLMNMNHVFEKFILKLLRYKLNSEEVLDQLVKKSFDTNNPMYPAPTVRADIIVKNKLIVDAKYSKGPFVAGKRFRSEHWRQLESYIFHYKLNGVLVYPDTDSKMKFLEYIHEDFKIAIITIPFYSEELDFEKTITDFIEKIRSMFN